MTQANVLTTAMRAWTNRTWPLTKTCISFSWLFAFSIMIDPCFNCQENLFVLMHHHLVIWDALSHSPNLIQLDSIKPKLWIQIFSSAFLNRLANLCLLFHSYTVAQVHLLLVLVNTPPYRQDLEYADLCLKGSPWYDIKQNLWWGYCSGHTGAWNIPL